MLKSPAIHQPVYRVAWAVSATVLAIVAAGCSASQPDEVVFVGAGDIGNCALSGAERTAELLDAIPGTVFTLGDHAYETGSTDNFMKCYDPWWGRHRQRTKPSPGNHDYETPDAAGYFAYFAGQADPERRGYYHFTLGAWHIYSLNSVVPADRTSAQYRWLSQELARNVGRCTLAYWHQPVRSSAKHGSAGDDTMVPIWQLLAEHGADVVLAGHDHLYERYAPMDANLQPATQGIRQFVVGTGGGELYQPETEQVGNEIQIRAWGVLKLVLKPDRYSWEFVPVAGRSTRDAGDGMCH
jgi:hypothetical protein